MQDSRPFVADRKMTAKEQTLKTLEECRGKTVSGEKLAADIGVSRAAVWKAVESLRKEGHIIAATTNKGYILSEGSDILSEQGIVPFLSKEAFLRVDGNIFVYKLLESTNQTAKQNAFEGSPAGTVILAEEQSKGKGRLGRPFYSPAKQGLYMSLIIRPDFGSRKSLLITTAASVAVCRAVKNIYGLETQIKWVNDIFFEGRKVCGILTEATTHFESGQFDAVVVGIGINCNWKAESIPEDIRGTAGALPGKISRNRLAAEVINEFFEIAGSINVGPYPVFMDEYRRRSMVLRKDIKILDNTTGEFNDAKAIDVSDEGGLIVIHPDGRKETLTSGEITIRL